MTHEIEGIVLGNSHPARQIDRFRSAVRRPLGHGLVFVPLTDALSDEIVADDPTSTANLFPMFRKLSAALAKLLSEMSTDGAVAYIETEYFGGAGDQAAAVWEGRRLAMAPTKAEIGPINAALEALGVVAGSDHDAFVAVGLHTHRRTDDWADQ